VRFPIIRVRVKKKGRKRREKRRMERSRDRLRLYALPLKMTSVAPVVVELVVVLPDSSILGQINALEVVLQDAQILNME
jgi:hypothetical protein